jgi:hypothetical protein
MAFKYGVLLRNAKLNAINTQLGATATLKVFSGAEAVNCAAGDPSGLLATIVLPSSPFAVAATGAVALNGTWSVAASGGAAGTVAASWRIYDSSAVCQIQGDTTDMTFNDTTIATGQTVQVTSFTITSGNS